MKFINKDKVINRLADEIIFWRNRFNISTKIIEQQTNKNQRFAIIKTREEIVDEFSKMKDN